MANELVIVGDLDDAPANFSRSTLPLGTETVQATVGANQIGIVIGASVQLTSQPIDELIKSLAQVLREREFTTT
ncbi:MAG: hypothetical protein DWQ49_09945 [Bacteroidetes bacterium]|mgnify:CR=1 FL=1|nr:MAG: hypothetical protein DWQ49_09945 [Bacteroidota bacterium]